MKSIGNKFLQIGKGQIRQLIRPTDFKLSSERIAAEQKYRKAFPTSATLPQINHTGEEISKAMQPGSYIP
jgi:hypothetical protein